MMTSDKFITEDYLREHFALAFGSELKLPLGVKLTPAAQALISERHLQVKYQDAQGQLYIGDVEKDALQHVHAIKSNNVRPQNTCVLCHSQVSDKPALLTHLNDTILVAKTHPQIVLRGKLDSCICYTVVLQTELAGRNLPSILLSFLADIRGYLGKIMQVEITGETLPLPYLGEIDSNTLHAWSHNPLKHLGYDHMIADQQYGVDVAKLNYLRALVRELEVQMLQVYSDASQQVTHPDRVAGLNRLSSAIYVLMILLWQHQNGQVDVLEKIAHATA